MLFPSLPLGEEGLSALRQAKQKFQEIRSKTHTHMHNAVKAVTGHDIPKVWDRQYMSASFMMFIGCKVSQLVKDSMRPGVRVVS